jgi:hypothetical protein
MTATHDSHPTASASPVLYLALELGWNSWKPAFTVGLGQSPRVRPEVSSSRRILCPTFGPMVIPTLGGVAPAPLRATGDLVIASLP